jgi:hypothetical protein
MSIGRTAMPTPANQAEIAGFCWAARALIPITFIEGSPSASTDKAVFADHGKQMVNAPAHAPV